MTTTGGRHTSREEEDNITLKEKGNLKRKKLKHEDGGVKPKKKDSKRQREDNSSNTELWYPIKNPCSPTQLAKVVKTLSTKQKDLIEKLGFGKLLSFQVDGIPQKLGHFVVDKFDAVKMEISLKDRVVRINVDTINWLLGIPKTDISQINWAAYVLDIIRNCKNGWKPFSNSPFKGALTILTLLYVASFLCEDMSVDHSIPPIEFWTLDRLHERQTLEIASGGFGRGKFIRLSSVDGETSNINNEEELRKMDLVIQALAATFENIFKEKVDIEKAHDSTELGIINNSVSGVGDSRSWKKDTIDERIFDICLDVNARRQQFIDSETDEEEAPEDEVRLEDKNQGLGGKDDVLEAEPQDKISLEDKNKGSEGRDQVWENANQNLMKELKLRRDKMGLEDQNQRLQGKDQLLEKAKQNLKEELKLKPGTRHSKEVAAAHAQAAKKLGHSKQVEVAAGHAVGPGTKRLDALTDDSS
ncbi:hypothetical protein E3N88_07017 [Mikania micrantha]|uniref:Uncharacterized protein n=1 Tax=Mikania micrantha TaxID=192012 RepID=A0A5N6PR27_9ASTR|nr:hypothetical protein E3N88_07017 [Mikania micrantha]